MPKTTVIVTVLNEVKTVESLVQSLLTQTTQPSQIIMVDGGSDDGTFDKLQGLAKRTKLLQIWQKKGNRSVGRNFAISQAQTDLIAITDAGCVPRSSWLAELENAFKSSKNQSVVAGYYYARPQTNFAQAVVPYALVMPDKIDPANFLPATRSMLLPKQVWKKMGGFNQQLADNEDYDFARRLKAAGVPIVFAPKAQVKWQPRSDLSSFIKMIFRFARGDAYAQLFRLKVGFIFVRYSLGLGVLLLWWPLAAFALGFYLIWSVHKNISYVPNGWYWLPILQVVSDLAVMAGTIAGLSQYYKKNVST